MNGGTSRYGLGADRLAERKTSSHNTATVDNEDSSEVWSGFRVARRAYPRDLHFAGGDETLLISCCHDGYRRLRGHPIHCRQWLLSERELVIEDEIRSSRVHQGIARFKLHPTIQAVADGPARWTLALADGRRAQLAIEHGRPGREAGRYAPEFGCTFDALTLTSEFIDNGSRVRLSW